MQRVHYLSVIAPGPLLIVRVPWPMPRWRDMLKALTQVMREHGLRQKDISAVESLTVFSPGATADEIAWYPEGVVQDAALIERLDAGFAGDLAVLPKFWLYGWNAGAFQLVRPPLS